MKSNKAQINQVFIYILSTIMIVFVGFLVVKFTVSFQSDSKAVIEEKFFNTLENDLKQVSARYGSEELYDYKINSEIKNICLLSKPDCTSEIISDELPVEQAELDALAESSNLLFFEKDGVVSQRKIEPFNTDTNNGCFCIQPKNTKFNLLVENRKNILFISQYLG